MPLRAGCELWLPPVTALFAANRRGEPLVHTAAYAVRPQVLEVTVAEAKGSAHLSYQLCDLGSIPNLPCPSIANQLNLKIRLSWII